MSQYSLSQRSIDRKKGVHPELDKLTDWLLQFLDVGINKDGGVRTLETQKEMVAKGVSKTLDSKHRIQEETGFGHALDYGIYVNGKL